MNAALMQVAFEAPTAAPPTGAGKPAASQGKDGGKFGAVFAAVVAADPQSGEAQKPDAETQAAGEATPVLAPGMWNVGALFAQPPQPSAPQITQDATGAIIPLADATAQTAQPQTMTQVAIANANGAVEQIPTEANSQPNAQSAPPATLQLRPDQSATAAQPLPDIPAVQMMPRMTPAATPEAVAAPAQAPALQPAVATPTPAQTPALQPAAAEQATTAQQMAGPTVISQAAITAAIAGGQRQPEKSAAAQAPGAKADAAAQPAGPNESSAAMPAVAQAAGDTQAAGDDSAALTAEKFPPAAQNPAPAPETANSNQMFATLVDQAAGRANAAGSAFAPTGEQAAPPSDPHNVAGQIVDNARLITRAENSEMVIRLKPEHLGELTLKIVVDSGVVSATFHTSNSEVRAAIEATLPQLRQDMANQGLKVDNVGVYASLDHFFANDQRHAPQQQQMPQTSRRTGGDEAFADTVATVAAIGAQTTGGGTGIDYRI